MSGVVVLSLFPNSCSEFRISGARDGLHRLLVLGRLPLKDHSLSPVC